MTPYGYEYCAQEVLFTPLLVADRVAYSVLSSMSQGDICLLKQDVRKSLFRTLANIYGRQVNCGEQYFLRFNILLYKFMNTEGVKEFFNVLDAFCSARLESKF